MAKKVKNKEILIKVICVLLSFGLWLYINNIENPVRERVINDIPVEIVNPQMLAQYGLALAPNQNPNVSLTISGPAAEVYSINKSQFRVVTDLISYGLKPGENNIPVSILNQPSGVSIKNTYPRVEINLENLEKKSINVSSEINVKNSPGTLLQNQKISPQTASIEGAESLVNQVSKLVVRGQVDNVKQSTVLNLPIIPVNAQGQEVEGVTVSPSTASVAINIQQGKYVPIKISTIGTLPSNLKLKGMTQSIQGVDIAGADQANVASLATTPIDLSKITQSTTIPVNIVLPKGTVNISGKDSLDVNIEVENITTTKQVSLPVTITGEQSGYQYTLNNATAEITFSGLAAALDSLNTSNISVQANVSKLTATGSAPLVISGLPSGVTATANPASMNVEVSKLTTPTPTPPPTEGGSSSNGQNNNGNSGNSNSNGNTTKPETTTPNTTTPDKSKETTTTHSSTSSEKNTNKNNPTNKSTSA
ncbi:MAG: CdaR family protein [Sarcina sp.]